MRDEEEAGELGDVSVDAGGRRFIGPLAERWSEQSASLETEGFGKLGELADGDGVAGAAVFDASQGGECQVACLGDLFT